MKDGKRRVQKSSFRTRKRILISVSVSLLAVIIAVLTLIPAFADGEDEGRGWLWDTITNANSLTYESDYEIIAGFDESDVTWEDANSLTVRLQNQHKYFMRLNHVFSLEGDKTGEGRTSLMYDLMKSENGPAKAGRSIIIAIGVVMVILYSVIKLITELKRAEGSPESILRPILVCVAGVLLVIFSHEIVNAIDELGGLIMRGIRDSAFKGMTEIEDVQIIKTDGYVNPLDGTGSGSIFLNVLKFLWDLIVNFVNLVKNFFHTIWQAIKSAVIALVFNITMIFTFYSILTSAYGLLFEMIIRKMFMPLALAGIVTDGVRGPAMRYVKGYLACYIRIGIFFVLVYLCTFMENWAIDISHSVEAMKIHTVLGSVGVIICMRTAIKSLINATGDLAKEIMGA